GTDPSLDPRGLLREARVAGGPQGHAAGSGRRPRRGGPATPRARWSLPPEEGLDSVAGRPRDVLDRRFPGGPVRGRTEDGVTHDPPGPHDLRVPLLRHLEQRSETARGAAAPAPRELRGRRIGWLAASPAAAEHTSRAGVLRSRAELL